MSVALVALAALAGTALSSPLVIRALVRSALLDIPNRRSSHTVPTPRGGGIAVVTGIALASAVAVLTGVATLWVAVGGALVLAGVGYADDRASLGTALRFGLQVLVGIAGGFLIGGGVGALVGLLLVPAVVNAFNFMDGINGISGATALVWGVSAAALGTVVERVELVVLGAMVAGSALGFLPWNVPRAKYFLGDVGSYFYGGVFALGILVAVTGDDAGPAIDLGRGWWLLAPLMIYAADTGYTLVKRARRGARITEAHREHVYQCLVDLPRFEHWQVAGLVGIFESACAFCGIRLLGVVPAVVLCAVYVSLPMIFTSDPRQKGGSA